MRKIKLYIAVSLNGKIAAKDGNVDWLNSVPNPDKTDYGYAEFCKSVDTTIMGFNTYQQLIDWGIDWPYPDKKNYILTGKTNLEDTEFVEFITNDHINFIKNLKEKKGQDIWLIGGGQTNTFLFNEGLIDELQIFLMPVVIPDGIELFEYFPKETLLKLLDVKSFSSGAVVLKYCIEK
ncbi:MAG: dihydrofolate reductase [Prolixibacteraceae bacterium]|nr:dihydrofolate reductase [Prolixibacteraceae bacterium]MBN2774970.1 dihydrofolate reductase [Prolixibacteraceae bacterium]